MIDNHLLAQLGLSQELMYGELQYSISHETLKQSRLPIYCIDIGDFLQWMSPYWGA